MHRWGANHGIFGRHTRGTPTGPGVPHEARYISLAASLVISSLSLNPATFLLTGFREEELCFLTWADVDLRDPENATLRVSGDGKAGFSPKDYEERIIPIPQKLAELLAGLTHRGSWVFSTKTGNRQTHLLRRLKQLAEDAKVAGATLHKFRHTYATRLLESGCDIVTVQKLMGHSDLDTTRQYLDPDEKLKRSAVSRLSLATLAGT